MPMLQRLRALWCERHGHRYHVVGRVYSSLEGKAREVLLEVCSLCGAHRDRPATDQEAAEVPILTDQARLDFLARARRRALRRARKRG